MNWRQQARIWGVRTISVNRISKIRRKDNISAKSRRYKAALRQLAYGDLVELTGQRLASSAHFDQKETRASRNLIAVTTAGPHFRMQLDAESARSLFRRILGARSDCSYTEMTVGEATAILNANSQLVLFATTHIWLRLQTYSAGYAAECSLVT